MNNFMNRMKFWAMVLIAVVFCARPTYAKGYRFLFSPSSQFQHVGEALANGKYFVVYNGTAPGGLTRYGICDSSGKIVLPMEYSRIYKDENLIICDNSGKITLFDHSDHSLNKLFDVTGGFKVFGDGSYIMPSSKSDILNRSGGTVIPGGFEDACYLGEGRFLIKRGGIWSVTDGKSSFSLAAGIRFADTDGYLLEDLNPQYIDYSEVNWLCAQMGGSWGVFDKELQKAVPFEYDKILAPRGDGGYFAACKGGKFGIVDKKGTVLVPFIYDDMTDVGANLYLVRNGEEQGVIDTAGNFIIPMTIDFLQARYIVDDYALLRNGEARLLPKYYANLCFLLKQKEKVGLIGKDGRQILPIEYEAIYSTAGFGGSSWFLCPDALIAVKDNKTGVITIDGEIIVPFKYDGININYNLPNNYKGVQYFMTLLTNGDVWTLGAVNRNNGRVAETYTFSTKDIDVGGGFFITDAFNPEPPAYNGPAQYMSFTFSPLNGLINGFSGFGGGEFKSMPESPVISYSGNWLATGDKLMYTGSYNNRGAVIVFDDFAGAESPVLDGWAREITFTIGKATWNFNGAALENDVAPFISGDRTMVPVRVIAESFGASVSWNDKEKTDYITKDGVTLKLTVGKALPDNMGTPVITGDRLFVPVRYIAEMFNGKVAWEPEGKTVTIVF
ncbi:MAG: WG repeat-containing protein [Clostridiales bacterium]|nr:WG repeat-containing protein [Clostridiales bacterium]